MSGERKPDRDWGPWLCRVSVVVGLVSAWALDVFTVQGFLASLHLAPTEDGMWWPAGTRVVWWVLFYVAGTCTVQRLMWREAVLLLPGRVQLWAASHVDAAQRIARRARWWAAGFEAALAQHRAHRPSLSWWRRILGPVTPAPDVVLTVVAPAPEPVDAPAAA